MSACVGVHVCVHVCVHAHAGGCTHVCSNCVIDIAYYKPSEI